RFKCDWSSDVCSSDLVPVLAADADILVLQRRRQRGDGRFSFAINLPQRLGSVDPDAAIGILQRSGEGWSGGLGFRSDLAQILSEIGRASCRGRVEMGG